MLSFSLSRLSFVSTASLLIVSHNVLAVPVINNVQLVADKDQGEVAQIDGSGFTKKENDKPLFYWKADLGAEPSPLGRKLNWDKAPKGELSDYFVAPNSKLAWRFDHGGTISTGAALGMLEFDSKQLYIFRRKLDDFNVTTDFNILTKVRLISGMPKIGQTVEGENGMTGIIRDFIVNEKDPSIVTLYYKKGSIAANKKFEKGHRMDTPTAIMENIEPKGTVRTFNNKIIRMWTTYNGRQTGNNIYFGQTGRFANQTAPEYTDRTLYSGSVDNPYNQVQGVWNREEFVYQAGDIDQHNGIFDFYPNGVKAWEHRFRMRRSDYVNAKGKLITNVYKPYSRLYQSQVSHAAQPGSYVYYDTLYVDDTWHRVITCSSPSFEQCTDREVQIPLQWSDKQITIKINQGAHDTVVGKYLYVFDAEGNVNTKGIQLVAPIEVPKGWSETVTISRVDNLKSAQIASVNNGAASAAWVALEGIFFSQYIDGSWQQPELLVASNEIIDSLQLLSNARGDQLLVWRQQDIGSSTYTPYSIYARYFDQASRSWSDSILLERENSKTYKNEIKADLDNLGNAIVAWRQLDQSHQQSQIFARRYTTDSQQWGTIQELSDAGNSAFSPNLEVDGSGHTVVTWKQKHPSSAIASEIYANIFDLSTKFWRGATLLHSAGLAPGKAQASLDTEGNIQVLWHQKNTQGIMDLFYKRYDARAMQWQDTNRLATGVDYKANPTIAEDIQGNTIVTWLDHHLKAKHLNQKTGIWSNHEIAQAASSHAKNFQLQVDQQGNGVMVWEQRGKLYRAQFLAGTEAWEPASVIATNINNPYLSLNEDGTFNLLWQQETKEGTQLHHQQKKH